MKTTPSPSLAGLQPLAASPSTISPRWLTIYFQDDAYRQRSQANVQQQLFASAPSSPAGDAPATRNAALFAIKALKYRKLYDRMSAVDVHAPGFDASAFLGVDWCHTPSLKAHCAARSH